MLRALGKGCAVLRLRACPRCAGDLSGEDDRYGPHWVCLGCGHIVEPLILLSESEAA